MSTPLSINGTIYQYPEVGDKKWGTSATDWATAVTNGCLQKSGGAFTLLAEVDFGASYGEKVLYIKSRTANPAAAGQVRLANGDNISFRNFANGADISLSTNASDQLTWNGVAIQGIIAYTVSRALQSNASTGFIEVSSVTNTELGYLSGVTSAIQTQMNLKAPLISPSLTTPNIGAATGTSLTLTNATDTATSLIVNGVNTGSGATGKQFTILNQNASVNTMTGMALQHYNASSVAVNAATIQSSLSTTTAAAEVGYLLFATMQAGTVTEAMRINGLGNVGIGTASPNANALLDITSTTKAFMPPRMTTTQKNAIASPTAGMVVYDSTLGILSKYSTAWSKLPTVQRFTSGSGTYTTPAGVVFLKVTMVAGGGGGLGSGSTNGTGATSGANTTFLTSGGGALLTATAGAAGGNILGGVSGNGGGTSISAPAITVMVVDGACGSGNGYSAGNTYAMPGAQGGMSALGGGGKGGTGGTAGAAGIANTGGGGGGGAGTTTANISSGTAGGAGGFIVAFIPTPSATYDYAVGAGGTAGTAGTSGVAGGAGGTGVIVVEEFYA